MERAIRVASVQFESAQGDKAANFEIVERFLARAVREGAELVLFPECCLTGYWFLRKLSSSGLAALAEHIPEGPSAERLAALARRFGVIVGAGLLEAGDDGHFYNSYIVALPGGALHRHRKLHAFEHELVRSGDSYTVFDTPLGTRMGLLICYDCNLIENVRMTALLGAEVLLAPHQTGGCRTRNPHLMGAIDPALWHNRSRDRGAIERELRGEKGRGWLMRWLPSRAHDNGLFLVFSNGIGVDDDEIRTGNAMILDPYGRILAETNRADDDMVVADLDPALLADATGRLWIAARRPELYQQLCTPTGLERDVHELKRAE